MFPPRYFPHRYFPVRYFPDLGAASVTFAPGPAITTESAQPATFEVGAVFLSPSPAVTTESSSSTFTIGAGNDVPVVGLEASGAIGALQTTGDANTNATGLAATGQLGTVIAATSQVIVSLNGLGSVAALNDVTVIQDVGVPVTGQAAVTALGQVTPNIDRLVPISGLFALTALGTTQPVSGVTIALAGVEAVASLDSALVWSGIAPVQNPGWVEITP